MGIISLLKKIKKSRDSYQPLIEVKIFREHLLYNLHSFQTAFPKFEFAPVLKSNAYGHGLTEVAEILDGQKRVPFFVVDSLFEARSLRGQGVGHPLLVIGYTSAANIISSRLKNIAFTITSLDQLREVAARLNRHARFHLKFDTGMRRQGLAPAELDEAAAEVKKNPHLIIEGVCSHLPDADNEDRGFTDRQIQLWNTLVGKVQEKFGPLPYRHLANSIGPIFEKNIDANVARLGLGLYGIKPAAALPLSLMPVLQMESVISSVRTLKQGEGIGYNLTFVAPRDLTAATVPAGYNEGIDRRLSNAGQFTVGEIACPIIGRVSMNITSFDASKVTDARLGQNVVLISAKPGSPNSVERIAQICQTIPYEILVQIPAHLRRVVI